MWNLVAEDLATIVPKRKRTPARQPAGAGKDVSHRTYAAPLAPIDRVDGLLSVCYPRGHDLPRLCSPGRRGRSVRAVPDRERDHLHRLGGQGVRGEGRL